MLTFNFLEIKKCFREQSLGLLSRAFLFFLLFSVFLGNATVHAQSNQGVGVIALNSEKASVSLERKIFLFEDKFGKYNLAAAWKEINNNPQKFLFNDARLRLSSSSSAYWLLLRINNQSNTENWVLDFGDTYQGRSGFVKKIMAYDVSAKKVLLRIFGEENTSQEKRDDLIESALMLELPNGKTSHIMLYIEPAEKKPFIIAPNLIQKTYYFSSGLNWLDRHNITIYSYIGLLFMMVAFALTYRKPHQIFGALFLLFGLISYFVENSVVYVDTPMPDRILFFSFILTQISLFYFFYNYFYDKLISPSSIQKLSVIMPGLAFIITNFALFAVPSDYSYLVFLGAVLTVSLASFILFIVNLKSQILTKYLSIFSGAAYFVFISLGAIVLEFPLNIDESFIIFGSVYAQLILSILLILSMPIRRPASKKSAAPLSGIGKNVFNAGSNYKDSKDMVDRERLLRVLDRERELLEEARTREAQKTDEMRLAKEQADDANQAKSAFLAVISHEIRTPITGVLGMVKLLQETHLSDTQKDYAQTIQDSGDAMLALLNDILDYEKIESGKLDLEYISFDVARVMRGIERLMSGHAEAKNIELVLDIEPEVPRFVVGDPTRLRQVVLNLLSNAIKFTDYGEVSIFVKMIGTKSVDASNVSGATVLSGDLPVHSVYFGVQDSGIGISSEAQKNLFTPFTQAKAETTRKYGGTGLGLSICQKLINAMGGEISVSSKDGEGSTFFFTLDMQEGDAAEALDEQVSETQGEDSGVPYKVLAVDDNSINLKVLNGFLDKLGHNCFKAESGEAALELLRVQHFDFILMDVNMRGMSGLETTRLIREMDHIEKAAIPIIALTGNSGQDAVHECYHAGMDDYILKPVSPKGLQEIVRKFEDSEFANEFTTKKYKEIRQTILETGGSDGGEDISAIAPEIEVADMTDMPLDEELPPLPSQVDQTVVNHESASDVINNEESAISLDINSVSPLQQFIANEEKQSVDEVATQALNHSSVDHSSYLADIEARGDIFETSLMEALKLSMNKGELMSLVDGFDEKAQEILAAMAESNRKKDWAELSKRAHELKGMSGNFGLRALSELTKELENIIKGKKFKDVEYFMTRIPSAYALGLKAIREWIVQ